MASEAHQMRLSSGCHTHYTLPTNVTSEVTPAEVLHVPNFQAAQHLAYLESASEKQACFSGLGTSTVFSAVTVISCFLSSVQAPGLCASLERGPGFKFPHENFTCIERTDLDSF